MKKTRFDNRFCWLLAITLLLTSCGGGGSDGPAAPVAQPDPLAVYQWHLENTGQKSFSSEQGTPRIDLNLASLFAAGITGQGVKVLVLDDGLDINHPDLAANMDPARLHNFLVGAANPNDPTPANISDAHGTAVAGIIGAVANNGIGGRGVAPGVTLGGANLLCDTACSPLVQTILSAYGGDSFSANADVINASYGTQNAAPIKVDIDTDAVMRAITGFAGMRGGRGLVMVKSAGNSFSDFKLNDDTWTTQCAHANIYKISCQNASFDFYNDMPQVVTVGAVNARGIKASYSTAGSSLLVAGLGGEYGKAIPTTPEEAGPAIVTTDLAGCDRGEARTNTTYINDFEQAGTPTQKALNPNCDYTSTMNGTSAAAPTVTGVVALMLGANPNLSWRDLRLILTKTARKIDVNRAPLVLPMTDGNYIAEPGWTMNAAGLWFHNWYGFGLVDAAAAVKMAKSTTSYLPGDGLIDGGWKDAAAADTLNLNVPVGTKAGVESTISFDPTQTIETVQIRVTIAGTAPLGDLGIELISPSGTRSVLMTAHNAFQNSTSIEDLLLLTNAFNEESTQGISNSHTWKLRAVDVNGRHDVNRQAILKNWSVRIYGR